jgi:hypothetical protein
MVDRALGAVGRFALVEGRELAPTLTDCTVFTVLLAKLTRKAAPIRIGLVTEVTLAALCMLRA